MAATPTGCTYRRTFRPRISGHSFSTTSRPVRCSKPTNSFQVLAAPTPSPDTPGRSAIRQEGRLPRRPSRFLASAPGFPHPDGGIKSSRRIVCVQRQICGGLAKIFYVANRPLAFDAKFTAIRRASSRVSNLTAARFDSALALATSRRRGLCKLICACTNQSGFPPNTRPRQGRPPNK